MVADRRATCEPSTTMVCSPFSPQTSFASSAKTESRSIISLINWVFAVTLSILSRLATQLGVFHPSEGPLGRLLILPELLTTVFTSTHLSFRLIRASGLHKDDENLVLVTPWTSNVTNSQNSFSTLVFDNLG